MRRLGVGGFMSKRHGAPDLVGVTGYSPGAFLGKYLSVRSSEALHPVPGKDNDF